MTACILVSLYTEVLKTPMKKNKASESYSIAKLFGRSNHPVCFQTVLNFWVVGEVERTICGLVVL